MIFFAGFQPDANCSYRVDDMVLTKQQMQEAFGDFDLSDRSGINDADFRWKDNKLPYVFDKSIETKEQDVVKKTINRFNKTFIITSSLGSFRNPDRLLRVIRFGLELEF